MTLHELDQLRHSSATRSADITWISAAVLGVTDVVEPEGARLLFPDERAADIVPHLRHHWANHVLPTASARGGPHVA
jgi:hypothetical protein